jgi:FtsH-binding integral membrane protein
LATVATATFAAYIVFIAGPTPNLFAFSLSFGYWSFLVPLVGVIWLRWPAERSRRPAIALIAGVFLTALLLSSTLSSDAESQGWFFYFGWIAALALSAEGFVARYRRFEPTGRRMLLVLPVVFGVVAVLVGGVVFAVHGSRAGRLAKQVRWLDCRAIALAPARGAAPRRT